jgi:hypothetical protein
VDDSAEMRELGRDPAPGAAVAAMESGSRKIVDPEAANARAFADQKAKIAPGRGVCARRCGKMTLSEAIREAPQ